MPSRPRLVPRLPRPSIQALVAVTALLLGCAAHQTTEPLVDDLDPPSIAPITRSSPELPYRALPAEATAVAPPLSLIATDGTALRLVSLRAEASVQEPLAYTELHLVFENPEERMLDGRFTIDLPARAALARFAIEVDDRWQEAEVVDQEVPVAYEPVRQQEPARLEQEADSRFAARVSPIPARGRKELVVAFSQELPDSETPYRLPLRGLPRLERLDARILVDVPDASTADGPRREVIEAHEEGWVPDRDLEVSSHAPRRAVGIRNRGVALARVTASGAIPPVPITDLTILFDTSASRALGFDAKIRRLGELVAALRERQGDFPLRVVAFDQDVSLVFSGVAGGFGQAELDQLYTRRPLGASDLASALRRATTITGQGSRVLLFTDGSVTAGNDHRDQLVAATYGLGRMDVPRVDAIVHGPVRDGGALAAITNALPRHGVVADGRLPVARLAEKLLSDTLPAIDIEVEGSEQWWPKRMEGVQPGDEILVYAELPKQEAMTVVVTGETGLLRTEVPLVAVEGPLLRRSWVGTRIAALEAERSALPSDATEDHARLRREIIGLSTQARVLSSLTAMLVLATDDDYARAGLGWRRAADILVMGPDGLERQRRGRISAPAGPDVHDGGPVLPWPARRPEPPEPSGPPLSWVDGWGPVAAEPGETPTPLFGKAERTAGSPYSGRMFDVMTELEAGRLAPALEHAVAWHDEAPSDILALLALGQALERNGHRRAAARAYGSLFDLHPARAELRLHAASRLERLGDVGLPLAIDGYRRAVTDLPYPASGHRMLAYAQLRAGHHQQAWDALVFGLEQDFLEGEEILRDDLGIVAAAWLRAEPELEPQIRARVALARVSIATTPSARFVASWESHPTGGMALHVHDGQGGQASHDEPALASGGRFHFETARVRGLACFVIDGRPEAYPYHLQAVHHAGPVDPAMGTLQIVEHDGRGGLRLDTRPFLVMKDQATVELGEHHRGWASLLGGAS